MADKLTPQQAMAITDRGGKLLVSAAAGSGKTKVLVDRLLKYIQDPVKPANLDEFLIITYTKAAASELRGKIAEKLSQRIAENPENVHLQKQMQRLYLTKISTVHGFCAEILREYAYRLDLAADFRVADENECQEIRQTVITDLLNDAYLNAQNDPDFRALVDTQGLGRDDRLVPDIVQKLYDSAMCHKNPGQWLEKCLNDAQLDNINDVSETVWGRFLMDYFFSYLDKQLLVMGKCLELAQKQEGFEKVCTNLSDVLYQLQALRNSETWDDIANRKQIDFGRLIFPRKNVDLSVVDLIKDNRNACKKGLDKKMTLFSDFSDQILSDMNQIAAATRGLVTLTLRFSESFSAAKKNRRVLDFSDLEHKTLELLLGKNRSHNTTAAIEIGNRFTEIMVDEYQDSNGVQDAIFSALTENRNNCFMVGDVKQSIYQFRLADPGIFLEKYASYLPAENALPGEGRKILLSHNFRSGAEVISAVNDVFFTCMTPEVGGLHYTEAEALREGIPHTPIDGAIELYAVDVKENTYEEEASFVAERIAAMLHGKTLIRSGQDMRPVKPEDIVILLRSPGSIGHYYQTALEEKNIRCSTGGSVDLLQTEEISTIRALLEIIVNPRQDIHLVAALASPIFGFTADDLAAFRSKKQKGNVYDALCQWNHEKAHFFLETLEQLRQDAVVKPLSQLLERCFTLTRLDSIYAAMPGGEVKRANLQIFYHLAAEYEMDNSRDLKQFLTHLDALEGKGLINTDVAGSDAVTIMSIHKSKGLEFPVVFLCGLSREFNKESLRAPILCDQDLGVGLSVADNKFRIRYPSVPKRAISVKMASESLSEEMRVLYVAMTRARDRLIMTYASRKLETDLRNISQRLDFDKGSLLDMEASCPGDWIMHTAMTRTEAGALFQLGGKPKETKVSDIPWNIQIVSGTDTGKAIIRSSQAEAIPQDTVEKIRDSLRYSYPHIAATQTPSKQTATGLKGRAKDEEAAENTFRRRKATLWRKPSFKSHGMSATDYGNVIHTVMQYIHFDRCINEAGIREEIQRLVDAKLLREQDVPSINYESITRFFRTPLGMRLIEGTPCIREFKFSILDDGSRYGDQLEGEKVLLQGVVDCALLDDDGIIILDFKTDNVTEEAVYDAAEKYRPQVNAYANAMTQIFEKPVKTTQLYFFRIGKFIAI